MQLVMHVTRTIFLDAILILCLLKGLKNTENEPIVFDLFDYLVCCAHISESVSYLQNLAFAEKKMMIHGIV